MRKKTIVGLTPVWKLSLFLIGGKNRTRTNLIKKRRKEKKLTQSDLALLIGISKPTISQFEIGLVSSSEVQIKKITKILGIGPGTLNKELHQFYEARKSELKKRIEGDQKKAEIPK